MSDTLAATTHLSSEMRPLFGDDETPRWALTEGEFTFIAGKARRRKVSKTNVPRYGTARDVPADHVTTAELQVEVERALGVPLARSKLTRWQEREVVTPASFKIVGDLGGRPTYVWPLPETLDRIASHLGVSTDERKVA